MVVFLFGFFDDGKRDILENPRSPWILMLWLGLNIPISQNEDVQIIVRRSYLLKEGGQNSSKDF